MRTCSACAGDYEDPDRTAGEEFDELPTGADEYEWQDEEECDELDGFDVDFDELKKNVRNHDEKESQEGSTTETAEEATRCVVRRDAFGGRVRVVVDAGGAIAREALRGSKHLRAVAPFAETAIRRVRGGEASAGSGGGFVRRGTRAGLGIPAESRGEARCCFRDGAQK
jgi:hypothetical protein